MEFQRERVYTSLNADELRAGDKVIVADQLSVLKQRVQEGKEDSAIVLQKINGEDWGRRFGFKMSDFALAYLVERKENCTNCVHREGEGCKPNVSPVNCCPCYDREVKQSYIEQKAEPKASEICINCEHYSTGYCNKYYKSTRYDNTCPDFLLDKPKTGQMCLNCKHYNKVNDFRDCTLVDNPTGACPHYEAEGYRWVNYRPFKDTDELIKVWIAKRMITFPDLTLPLIWVREKGCNKSADLITCYGSKGITVRGKGMYFDTLFTMFEFLDGSPCGVEE